MRGTHRRAASGRGGTPTTESNPRSQEGYTSIRDEGREYWVFEKSGTKSVPPKCLFLIGSVSYPKNRVIFAERRKNFCRNFAFFDCFCFSTKNALRAFFASRFVFRFAKTDAKFCYYFLSKIHFNAISPCGFFVKKVSQELLFPRNIMRILDFSFLQFLRFLAQKFFCPFSLEFALEDICFSAFSQFIKSLGTFSVIRGKVSITQIVLFVFTSKFHNIRA